MAEHGVVEKGTPCIACEGNAENGRTLGGTTPITEPGYSAGFFRLCKQCLRGPRIAAEKLTVRIDLLKASNTDQRKLEFLERIVVPAMNGLVADHRLKINEY